ncbi:HAD-IA family hydrolase [Succinivibrio dextrinosolvens]|uniref:HAD-IA family hydrolase n=1 Tax=Succinivibrio dextrinosolvens TaxID=83771 RepID=UPI0004E1CEB9|nr:HAD-IA family hydrolase [Succinivibrio dextrinosolvens]
MSKLKSLPEALLFDLDGTLADTIVQLAKAARASAVSLGLNPPAQKTVQEYVGNGVNMLLARVIAGRFDITLDAVDKKLLLKAREVFNQVYAEGLKTDFRVYDGVIEGLKYFKERGIKLAVVTNKPQIFADPLLKCMGIYDYFDFVLGGEVLKQRKPDPAPLQYCLDKIGVSNDKAVMIGDSDNDIIAGLNAKICTVFFTYGYNRANLDELEIDYKFDSFTQLIELITSLK